FFGAPCPAVSKVKLPSPSVQHMMNIQAPRAHSHPCVVEAPDSPDPRSPGGDLFPRTVSRNRGAPPHLTKSVCFLVRAIINVAHPYLDGLTPLPNPAIGVLAIPGPQVFQVRLRWMRAFEDFAQHFHF